MQVFEKSYYKNTFNVSFIKGIFNIQTNSCYWVSYDHQRCFSLCFFYYLDIRLYYINRQIKEKTK